MRRRGCDPRLSLAEAATPSFANSSQLIEDAFLVARSAHEGPGHGDIELSHPVTVAELLSRRSFDEAVVAAALLHDTVEDTRLTVAQIESRFGIRVALLVAEMTEDRRINSYPARKAEARGRAARDSRVAAIYTVDKLVSTRRLLKGGEAIDGERLDHFVKTLRLFSELMPELPFLDELSAELTRLIDRDARRIGTVVDRI